MATSRSLAWISRRCASRKCLSAGIFLAGGIVAGRETNHIFIENGRFHGKKIVDYLTRS